MLTSFVSLESPKLGWFLEEKARLCHMDTGAMLGIIFQCSIIWYENFQEDIKMKFLLPQNEVVVFLKIFVVKCMPLVLD